MLASGLALELAGKSLVKAEWDSVKLFILPHCVGRKLSWTVHVHNCGPGYRPS